MEPVVLSVRPREGWQRASRWQRGGGVGMLGLFAVLLSGAALELDGAAGALVLALVMLGGPLCHACAARILRPWPERVGWERKLRHSVAALGGAWGSYTILLLSAPGVGEWVALENAGALLVLGALLAGTVSAPWGVLAALIRALSDGGGRQLRAAREQAHRRDAAEQHARETHESFQL